MRTDHTVTAPQAAVLLEANDVSVTIPTSGGIVTPVDHVSLTLRSGEVLGIVGETGSGKTVTCRSLLGLMPSAQARHTGSVTYPGVMDENVLDAGRGVMRKHWGTYISMIPQNPMTSLNPVHRIGDQIAEAIAAHSSMPKSQRFERIVELMTRVGIPNPQKRMRDYPHQFSGGMLQRTLIAIALAGDPRVLIADEPTTALDVIIQDQILSLLVDLQRDLGTSLVLVSHDLSVIAQVCDRVAVMYGGQVVELAETATLLHTPRHPYTNALLKSLPGAVPRDQPLTAISGSPPRLIDLPDTCRFLPRCTFADEGCSTWTTELLVAGAAGSPAGVRCRRHQEIDLQPPSRSGQETPPRSSLVEPMDFWAAR
ncbi:hypothetical protein BA895_10455 [Humibacillus sp. DSM 29435]|uniref:ABC transporter ATP-binding protein n=1 Tax=Humibacillus sp. DSM 29435 TaxID=1869167 RepID=UPI000871F949|nr:ABC transporter ATP-binding protein [Humibacillus sp. DSM 29435]OFE14380.1 hypothetical protein BA895_10455 [Humibacillus sp. DSM 29435]